MDTHIALSLLIVDDSDDDALIAEEAIRRGGYTVSSKRVDTADGLKEALGRRTWDLILCDYRMPNFSGLDALSLVRQQDLDLPFILISGALGEETAVGALKAGANDYIMKGNPARLVPSVQRALREVRERQELRRAVDRLRASELLYRSLVETSPDAIAIVSLQGIILIANRQAGVIFHCPSPDALVGQRVLDLVVLAEREKAAANLGAVASGTDLGMRIYMAQRQDGTTFSVELQSAFIPSAGAAMADCIMMVARDVTERLRLAEHLRFQANLLATVGEAVIATDTSGNITYWNQAATAIYGWASDDVLGQNILSILPMEPSSSKDRITLASLARGASSSREYLARHRSGRPIPILVTAVPLRDEGGEVIGVIGVSSDNTARKTAEELLSSERDLLTTVMDALPDTVYVKDTQSRFVRVNTAQAQYLGAATPEETVGKTEFDYLPHARARARLPPRIRASSQPECHWSTTWRTYWTAAIKSAGSFLRRCRWSRVSRLLAWLASRGTSLRSNTLRTSATASLP